MKTALASDFDNTLFFMDTEERFRAQDIFEILFYQKRGGLFGICTGRSPDSILDIVGSFMHPDFIISVSGALVVDREGKVLDSHPLMPDRKGIFFRRYRISSSDQHRRILRTAAEYYLRYFYAL